MSLDGDAFLNALTRFSLQREVPIHLLSDNDTNMMAADGELRAVVKTWEDDGHVRETLLARQIEWTFHPPHTSHKGGIWEWQIKTVHKVLYDTVSF